MRKLLLGLTLLAGALAFAPTAQAMPQLTTSATSESTSAASSGVETVQYYGRGERRREWRRREWHRRQAWRRGYRR